MGIHENKKLWCKQQKQIIIYFNIRIRSKYTGLNLLMKTIEQLKSEIYTQVSQSGYLKNVQAQVKAHVLDLIDKQSKTNKQKLGFQYQHPVLKKLRNYPLTSLCMDLIQQFLQSFKFKHTLNVFKKQINRDLLINRQNLSKQFSIDLSGKDQAVLLSIVGQIFNGDVRIIQKPKNQNIAYNGPKENNFMGRESKNQSKHMQQKVQPKKKQQKIYDTKNTRDQTRHSPPQKDNHTKKYDIPAKTNQKSKQEIKKQEEAKRKLQEQKQKQIQRQKQKQKQEQERKQKELLEKQKEAEKGKGKKHKKQEQKPPEAASDLLMDVISKFATNIVDKNKGIKQQQIKSKKAYSEEKQPKKLNSQLSGMNKINSFKSFSMPKFAGGSSSGGIVAAKNSGSIGGFAGKYGTLGGDTKKNEQIQQDIDQLQQSRDSTRRNPLYSSSQSGFDKSLGFDQSVDSNAIYEYDHIEKAKKMTKK